VLKFNYSRKRWNDKIEGRPSSIAILHLRVQERRLEKIKWMSRCRFKLSDRAMMEMVQDLMSSLKSFLMIRKELNSWFKLKYLRNMLNASISILCVS